MRGPHSRLPVACSKQAGTNAGFAHLLARVGRLDSQDARVGRYQRGVDHGCAVHVLRSVLEVPAQMHMPIETRYKSQEVQGGATF